MEVKIGVQNASRELSIDTTMEADDVEKAVAAALDGGVLVLDTTGRSAWVTVGDLERRVDKVVADGGALCLSTEQGSALADPVTDRLRGCGAPVRDVEPDEQFDLSVPEIGA